MKQKFLDYFRFVDTCAEPGCPLCRCAVEAGRRYLDALIYEQVNDADTRRAFRASWGFCNWHTWMLQEIQGAAFGTAILCEDMLRLWIHRLGRTRGGVAAPPAGVWARIAGLGRGRRPPRIVELHRRRRMCTACAEVGEAEARYVDTILAFFGDLQFRRAYERSDGLCAPHVLLVLGAAPGGRPPDDLVSVTLGKWAALRRTLDRFVSKHDYRNKEPFTEEERASLRQVAATLSGAPGLFGSDVARSGRTPRRESPRPAPNVALASSEGSEDSFERGKLELRIRELTEELNDATTRAAALHYRLWRVAEDRNVLEMNLTGTRGANELAERVIADLRSENERLREELASLKARPRQRGPAASR